MPEQQKYWQVIENHAPAVGQTDIHLPVTAAPEYVTLYMRDIYDLHVCV